jgi:hypothetical protein
MIFYRLSAAGTKNAATVETQEEARGMRTKWINYGYCSLAGVGFLALMGLAGTIDYEAQLVEHKAIQAEREVAEINQALVQREARLSEFFSKQGSTAPLEMSKAVAMRKRPRLLAAMAAVESNARPEAIGKAGEVTAWQIKECFWGPVGTTVEEHSLKVEDILEKLIKKNSGNLRAALSAYSNDSSDKYATKVLKKVSEVKI